LVKQERALEEALRVLRRDDADVVTAGGHTLGM